MEGGSLLKMGSIIEKTVKPYYLSFIVHCLLLSYFLPPNTRKAGQQHMFSTDFSMLSVTIL